MSEFDAEAFLEWLEEQDGYSVPDDRVREEWPGFYDEHDLFGITVAVEDGEPMVPKRDYRDAVLYGKPLD